MDAKKPEKLQRPGLSVKLRSLLGGRGQGVGALCLGGVIPQH